MSLSKGFAKLFRKEIISQPMLAEEGPKIYDGLVMLKDAAQRNNIHLSILVAETAIWANPNMHEGTAWYPNTRRCRTGHGEKRGEIVDGVKLDDNTCANQAIKRAVGIPNHCLVGFESCHIWPNTCYDPQYHTTIANLVLIPRAIAGLSDHDPEVQAVLQYRSYELYGWYPEGQQCPSKPAFYPRTWREPEAFNQEVLDAHNTRRNTAAPNSSNKYSDPLVQSVQPDCSLKIPQDPTRNPIGFHMPSEEKRMLLERIRKWSKDPTLKVHKMIALVTRARNGLSRELLVQEVSRVTKSKNPYGAVGSLLTSKGNAYGRVFIDIDGIISIHPEMVDEVSRSTWRV
ncbi:MAG: hypothetical protein WA125_11145 [Desulfosporosinus sp.]